MRQKIETPGAIALLLALGCVTVLVPAGDRLVAVAGDRLATVKKNALDVPSLTLHRVRTR